MMLDDEEGSEVADSLQTNVFRGPSSSFQLELPRRVLFQAKVTALNVYAVLFVGHAVEGLCVIVNTIVIKYFHCYSQMPNQRGTCRSACCYSFK